MIRRVALSALSALSLALLAGSAHADLRPGVQVSFKNLQVARAGVPIQAQATIQAAQPVTIKQFVAGMRGTTVSTDAPADSLLLPANGTHTINLSVTPVSNDDALEFSFVANGFKYVFKRNLSQYWSDLRNYGQAVGFDPQPEPPAPAAPEMRQAPDVQLPVPEVSLYGRPVITMEQAQRRAEALGATAVETHTFNLQVRYERPDNKKDAVDGAAFTLWQKGPGIDLPIASGTTTSNGLITRTVNTLTTFGRTFYITFSTTNSWVHVLNNDDDDDPYRFKSSEFNGPVGGGSNNKVFLVGKGGTATPALHMLTTITRGFRFILDETAYQYPGDIDDLDVSWPESDWPHYTWPVYETLYIPDDSSWRWATRTFLHEFGHHVNWELPISINQIDYDDGNCELEGNDGRHCRWCAEDDEEVATMEGFASWIGDMVALKYKANYGVDIYDENGTISGELIGTGATNPAGNCPVIGVADRIEGHYWSLLRDLADSENESDPNFGVTLSSVPGLSTPPQDRLSLGFAAVLDILADYNIDTVPQFRARFHERYDGSLPAEDIWNTFANAGYWYDTTAPLAPTNVRSSDHSPGVSSSDNSITFLWDPAFDSQSGIGDHNLWLYRNGTLLATGPATDTPNPEITFSDLSPGSYYLRVVAIDRAGNVNNAAVGQSPAYVIRDPYPTDLDDWFRTGWDESHVVPRVTNNATASSVTAPPYLAGGKDSTWFNWAVENTGEINVTSTFRTRLVVDGVVIDSVMSSTSLGLPLNSHTVLNRGPYNIRPGRHTVELWTDAEEEIAEPNEADNRFGRQWVWEPPSNTTRGADHREAAPPRRDGGWNVISVPIGQQKPPNVIAHKFTHNNGVFPISYTTWLATELWAEPPVNPRDVSGVNYDLRLELQDRDPYIGFVNSLATSARGSNLTDAVITNYVNAGTSAWEVGVENMSNDSTAYHLRVNTAGTMNVGDSVDVSLFPNQMVSIRGLQVASGDVGKITVEVRRIAGTSKANVSYLSASTSWATLAQALGDIPTDANGRASMSFTAGSAGNYALLVWRDPGDGKALATYRVKVSRKPADLAIVTPSGWSAPLVPRHVNDATSVSAPAPPILYGDDKPTYVSSSRRNNSDVAAGVNSVKLLLDDLTMFSFSSASLAALTTVTNPNVATLTIPGGRHVLSQVLDPNGLVVELDELNNTYGQQFVWTPDTVLSDRQQWRKGQLGGITAGWEFCQATENLYFNMDGIRLPTWTAGTDFAAVALTPRDTADVDLGLYLTSNNATTGFQVPQEDSNWGPGQTDLLLLNFTLAPRKAYDIGIQRVSEDTTSYVVDVVPGVVRDPNLPVLGPFTLAPSRTVHVHQFALPVGRHTFHLRNLTGTVDWGMAAYDADRPFQDRSQGEERGWSYANGAGADEELVVVLDQPSTIALVVYKTGSGETAKSGSYQIERSNDPTDSPVAGIPARTRLAGAFPNPSRGGASVHFDLAQAGEVELEVYDLRGARVRTLMNGKLPAGRHASAWDGRDARGRALPAGVYLVRMGAPGYEGQAKVVRVE